MNVVRWLMDKLAPENPAVGRHQDAARTAVASARETIKQEQHLTDVRLRVLLDLTDITQLKDNDG